MADIYGDALLEEARKKATAGKDAAVAQAYGAQSVKPTGATAPGQNEGLAQPRQQTTYIDANGNKRAGIMDGAATNNGTEPAAPAGTEPVPAQEPEPAEAQSYWDEMRQYYENMYEQQRQSNDAAAAAATKQALEQIQAQVDALAQEYQGTNKQLYRDYMTVKRQDPQQLAAKGYTGGMTESSRLGLDMAYQEALAQNERARLGNVTSLNAQGAQAQYQAQAAAAQANSQAEREKLQYLAALQEQQQQQTLAEQQQRAELLAAGGDFSGYNDLGYTQEQTDYLTQLWLAQNPALKATWIAAHPEDAKRLGLTAVASGTERYYTPQTDTYRELYNQLEGELAGGASAMDIYRGALEAVAQGDLTAEQARNLRDAAARMGRRQTEIQSQQSQKPYSPPSIVPRPTYGAPAYVGQTIFQR